MDPAPFAERGYHTNFDYKQTGKKRQFLPKKNGKSIKSSCRSLYELHNQTALQGGVWKRCVDQISPKCCSASAMPSLSTDAVT